MEKIVIKWDEKESCGSYPYSYMLISLKHGKGTTGEPDREPYCPWTE